MKLRAKQIIQRYSRAFSKKGNWDNRYEEVFKYIMPERDNFYHDNNPKKNYSQGESKRPHLYTSTGEQAGDVFVNRIQSILTPIGKDWVGLQVSSNFPDSDERNRELDAMADLINSHKSASNFDAVISEFYYDLIAGTACLLVTEGTYNNPLNFKVIPINELCIDEGVDGKVDYVWRKFSLSREVAKYQWAELNDMEVSEEDREKEKEITLLECTYKDYEKDIYFYVVIDVEKEKIIVEREYKTNPFIVLRWTKCSGEVYGRGLGMKALNDVKSLNKITEYSLRALAFSIPTLLAQQDASFDADDFDLTPGALNVVPSTATSNPSVMPLQINPSHDITAYNVDLLKQEIKKTMLDNQVPPDANVRTATEIIQRVQDHNINISSVFGRLIMEFLVPIIKRMIEVLKSFKYIREDFEVEMIDGYSMKIKIQTPLATQQSQGEVMNIVNAASMLASFDPTGQVLGKVMKLDTLLPYLLETMGVPNRFINSDEEIKQIEEAVQKANREREIQQIQDDVASETAKAQGKEDAKQV